MLNILFRTLPFLLIIIFLSVVAWAEGTILLSLKSEGVGKTYLSTRSMKEKGIKFTFAPLF